MFIVESTPGSSPLTQSLSLAQEGTTGFPSWYTDAMAGGQERSQEHLATQKQTNRNTSAFNTKSNARRAPTSFTLQRKTSLAFSVLFFCEQASQPACAGADAERSSNSHSYILDVFARAHARRKDSGKPWQPWPEGSRPPSESIYSDCTDALPPAPLWATAMHTMEKEPA